MSQNYLIFHLYGSLASWGDIAIGETRPSYSYPTKSAIMGLIAAALGIKREQEELLLGLNQNYSFAVRVDREGVALHDYHTAQVPGQAALKKSPSATRRDELLIEDKNTTLSTRIYYCDGAYTIILWQKTDTAVYSLQQIAEALQKPYFTLYLGRKSCPLGFPVLPKQVQSNSIQSALQEIDPEWQGMMLKFGLKYQPTRLYWDTKNASDIEPEQTHIKQDQLISRKRWQYTDRSEYYSHYEQNT